MWSFGIQNIVTGEMTIIFGYNWLDAARRACIDPDEWAVLNQEYED